MVGQYGAVLCIHASFSISSAPWCRETPASVRSMVSFATAGSISTVIGEQFTKFLDVKKKMRNRSLVKDFRISIYVGAIKSGLL